MNIVFEILAALAADLPTVERGIHDLFHGEGGPDKVAKVVSDADKVAKTIANAHDVARSGGA